MHTVVETRSYLASAKAEGMTGEECVAVVDLLAADPSAGDMIVGSGGCRKVRVAGKGRGKSGGYRVVSFFAVQDQPVYLLAVLSKSNRQNFTEAEVAAMRNLSKSIQEAWKTR